MLCPNLSKNFPGRLALAAVKFGDSVHHGRASPQNLGLCFEDVTVGKLPRPQTLGI